MATDKLMKKISRLFRKNHVLFAVVRATVSHSVVRISGRVTVDYLAKDKQNIKTEKHYSVKKILGLWIFRNRPRRRLEMRDFLLRRPRGEVANLHKLSRDG